MASRSTARDCSTVSVRCLRRSQAVKLPVPSSSYFPMLISSYLPASRPTHFDLFDSIIIYNTPVPFICRLSAVGPSCPFLSPETILKARDMPLYEYQCQNCHETIELLVRSSTQRPTCPECGSPKLDKQLSVAASPAIVRHSLPTTSSAGPTCGRSQCDSGCMFD